MSLLAEDLGSSMRMLGNLLTGSTTTTNIVADAYTADVNTISYASAGQVDPGSARPLVKNPSGGTFLAVDQLGPGRLILTGDMNAWADWNANFFSADNDRLIAQLLS